MSQPAFDRSGTAWISKGFESLAAADVATRTFDVLIIGTGYGGAIAADTISRYKDENDQDLDIGILERGSEYLPGSFPANSSELPGHIRFGRKKQGLFDFRSGPDVASLVANGLGGGSLINAGVMLRARDEVFQDEWPEEYKQRNELNDYYERAEWILGVTHSSVDGIVRTHVDKDDQGARFKKLTALHDLNDGQNFSAAPVTVGDTLRPNSGYVQLQKCIHCGDCATGCNFGAKDSLDTNLLVNAYRRGARIYSGATVLYLMRNSDDDGWEIHAVFTDSKLRDQHAHPTVLNASAVILSAGTFGSTEILKRSEANGLSVSRMLGQRCSTNGDTLMTHYDTGKTVNAVGKEEIAPSQRKVGPTITGVLDFRDVQDTDLGGLVIEEMASPASMRKIFTEIYATTNTLHRLGDKDRETHNDPYPPDDIYEVKPEQIDKSSLYAVMGDDGAHGEIEITGALDDNKQDGTARMRWPGVAYNPLFEQQVRAFNKLTDSDGGHVIPNPMWKLLPDSVALISDMERGPVVTVHPLGGCAMADKSTDGAVNPMGEVFDDDDDTSTHDKLVVLDGSIIPTALSVNPALTIAAVALRSATMLAREWNLTPGPHAWFPGARAQQDILLEVKDEFYKNNQNPIAETRTPFRVIDPDVGFDTDDTLVRLTERMTGEVPLGPLWVEYKKWTVELTLRFDPKSLRELTNPSLHGDGMTVQVGGNDPTIESKLRIFEPDEYERVTRRTRPPRELEELLDERAAFVTSIVGGELHIFQRQKTWAWWRKLRAFFVWARNQGLRDFWQAKVSRDHRRESPDRCSLWKSLMALCSHAGEVRKFKYRLDLADEVPISITRTPWGSREVRGEKTFTYRALANPWVQLMQMKLVRFPGVMFWRRGILDLDLPFLARVRIPLLDFVHQHNGVTALADLGSFLAYIGRMLVGIHGLNFRAPDEPRDVRQPERLPGKVIGVGDPEIFQIYMGKERPARSETDENAQSSRIPVYARLSRYANPGSDKPPLIMMHGYSASGTTFTHNAIDNNFVQYFHRKGRDVWIADFRTSCGMPTASEAWSFEQVGYRDIPEIVKFVCEETDKPKVDVIAHCMGAAMFSMGLLHAVKDLPDEANPEARRVLSQRLNRVAFTQVGPLLVMSPMNIFRGYVMQYFRELLPGHYEFNPGPHPTVADNLLDRFLNTVPYPREEYRVENPDLPWQRTPWTKTRHRMDILYGRVFNAANVDRKALKYIDDFFGPLSIDTVTQTINFARYNVITDTKGRNTFVSRENLSDQDRWRDVPLLQVNACDNGLVDYRTVYRMEPVFNDAGCSFQYKFIDYTREAECLTGKKKRSLNAGHQDCLIGTKPKDETLDAISNYFDEDVDDLAQVGAAQSNYVAYPPWIGPVRTFESRAGARRSFRVGSRPTHTYAKGAVLFRVLVDNDDVLMPDGTPFSEQGVAEDYLWNNAYFMTSQELKEDFWGKFEFPPASNPRNQEGNAWLVLMVYNDAESLHEDTIGSYRSVNIVLPNEPEFRFVGQLDTGTPDWKFPQDQLFVPDANGAPTEEFKPSKRLILEGIAIDPVDFKAIVEAALELVVRPEEDLAVNDENFDGYQASLVSTDAVLDRLADENLDLRDGIMPDVPDAPADRIEFALSSCQYPAGFLDGPLAYRSYLETLDRVEIDPVQAAQADPGDEQEPIVPRFVVLAGDQIYADASAGLFDPSVRRGRFELPYHKWLRFPFVRGVMRQIPSFMLPDDHEVIDNWEPIPGSQDNTDLKDRGFDGYRKYQRGLDTALHFENEVEGCHFVMVDTRGFREARSAATADSARIIGRLMTEGIGGRISVRGHDSPPMFIVTPAMLLPRHKRAGSWDVVESSLGSDGWDGYPASLFHLLAEVVDNNGKNIVFLSGDEHMPCRCKIRITNKHTGKESIVYSIHTSAAYAPFPFANGFQAQQIEDEIIHFNLGANSARYASEAMTVKYVNWGDYKYRCELVTEYTSPFNSMTYIRTWKNNGRWSLLAQFGNQPDLIDDLASW